MIIYKLFKFLLNCVGTFSYQKMKRKYEKSFLMFLKELKKKEKDSSNFLASSFFDILKIFVGRRSRCSVRSASVSVGKTEPTVRSKPTPPVKKAQVPTSTLIPSLRKKTLLGVKRNRFSVLRVKFYRSLKIVLLLKLK